MILSSRLNQYSRLKLCTWSFPFPCLHLLLLFGQYQCRRQSKAPLPRRRAAPSPKQEGECFFTLDILNDTISVAYGVEESTLKKTPGWLTTSVLPVESGMCVVYGHRNRNHLKVLEKVERGDAITVTMDEGTGLHVHRFGHHNLRKYRRFAASYCGWQNACAGDLLSLQI